MKKFDITPTRAIVSVLGAFLLVAAVASLFGGEEKDEIVDGRTVAGQAGSAAGSAAAPPAAPLISRDMAVSSPNVAMMHSKVIAAPEAAGMAMEMYDAGFVPPQGIGQGFDGERYEDIDPNPVRRVSEHPVSTFSVDVDTFAYANVRRFLNQGQMPPKDAVRIEELVNYFDYDYPLPETREEPFRPFVTVYPSPWNAKADILHIGIKGFDVKQETRPRANLVFLIDISGSMNSQNKLPLLKSAFRMLVQKLDIRDNVSIVVYAGRVATVLNPTRGDKKGEIIAALDYLAAGGSTAGAEGIRLAYQAAEASFREDAVNRVILATDGDFNVGISDPEKLEEFIERKRDSGIYFSVLGFGMGNLNDHLMQKLAQAGNGNAAYIDTLNEARKVMVDEMTGTLFTISDDVKIQVEFNPALVSEYRLIGYETRLLRREDFSNDKVDAGDIGAGHTVTALYEIVKPGGGGERIEGLRYGDVKPAPVSPGHTDEIANLRIRYKLPGGKSSFLIERPVTLDDRRREIGDVSPDVRFAAAVAGFGQLLRQDPWIEDFTYDHVVELANDAKGKDEYGYRAEFVQLARSAAVAAAMPPLAGGHPPMPEPFVPYRQ